MNLTLASGEYAVEYLKRISRAFRVYLGIEGNQDEVEFITEVQWHFNGQECSSRSTTVSG